MLWLSLWVWIVGKPKKDSKTQITEMTFLRGLKRCSKLDRIRNEATREKLQVFNLIEKLKDCKQRWKEHFERISDSKLVKQACQFKPIGVDPGRDCWWSLKTEQAALCRCSVVKMMMTTFSLASLHFDYILESLVFCSLIFMLYSLVIPLSLC